MRRAIWISYDFGVRGDYEGFYTWLDLHDAIECGVYLFGSDPANMSIMFEMSSFFA